MDIVDKTRRSAMMAGIQGKDTKPELRVRQVAHALRIASSRRQRPDVILVDLSLDLEHGERSEHKAAQTAVSAIFDKPFPVCLLGQARAVLKEKIEPPNDDVAADIASRSVHPPQVKS